MQIRPLARDDLEACADVFYAADDELMTQRGLPLSPRNRVALLRLFGHISQTSPERAWLIERDSQVVAFGMAAQRDELVFLSFLYVRPDAPGNRRASLIRSFFRACSPARIGRSA